MDLNQRKLFTKKEFRLTESGLLVKNRSLTEAQEVVIPYEELATNKAIREVKTDMTMVIISGLIGIVFCVNLIDKLAGSSELNWGFIFLLGALALCGVGITLLFSKKQILIPTVSNGFVQIFDGKPTAEATETFLADLTQHVNAYLKKKYAKVDKSLPIKPQLNYLMWLKEREVLNEEEFETLKNTLIGQPIPTTPIGFRGSNI